MTIFIRTSGGGGIVLLVALALIFGHGSGISAVTAAVLLALVALAVLAVITAAAVLVRRLLPGQTAEPVATVIQAFPEPVELPGQPRAIEPTAVRLHPDQLEQLAEILRRHQRPE